MILGDFGLYDAEKQFLPNQFYQSILDFPESAGPDTINGGDGDDILMGQEGQDTIDGEGGNDDIYGGKFDKNPMSAYSAAAHVCIIDSRTPYTIWA